MSASNELDLLWGLLRDDPSSWREFYTQYGKLIYRCITCVAAKFPGAMSREDIEDAYNDVTVSLIKNNKRRLWAFNPEKGCCLGSWVGYVAVSTGYNHLRTLRRTPTGKSNGLEEQVSTITLDAIEAREKTVLLNRRLPLLSRRDQKFVELYFFRDMSAVEVAKRMNISVATVYTKKHKVRAKLKKLCADFI